MYISLNFLVLQNPPAPPTPRPREIPIPSVRGVWIFSGTAHCITEVGANLTCVSCETHVLSEASHLATEIIKKGIFITTVETLQM